MKVLILSCNTGGGHNSCAKAIGAELLNRGHTYETDDALLYVSKGTSRCCRCGRSVPNRR